ncbi:hypothetical protein F5Y16DRAFT_382973 [Xylariaceae sp. FL0255]|nr:hypothetical protein F5Y16DRAFT_382973 [Xylariaceae sp. FL0255]
MLVRESARQSEIRKKIINLPRGAQATHRRNEKARIKCRMRIQDAKNNGRGWSRLRDEYLLSVDRQSAQLS